MMAKRSTIGSNDQEIRDTLLKLVTDLDPEAEYELRPDEFVADIPQSGERIRGRSAMRELQRAYPPRTAPTFKVRRILGAGSIWTVEALGDYGGQVFHVVLIIELRDGKILRETRYYTQPFEAPDWRAQWASPIEPAGRQDDPPKWPP
jgi:hypothetical protein